MENISEIWNLVGLRYKSHPWHGIEIGENAPEVVTCFIEVVPSDTVKYEIDKRTGYLKADRPQKFSSVIPALYGFIPQTFCGERIAKFAAEKSGKTGVEGDGDPLDICVLTERNITHGDILVKARPIGGFRMFDAGEADDKIVAVLNDNSIYSGYNDIDELPLSVVNRLKHYFLSYKEMPGQKEVKTEITGVYKREEALQIIKEARKDYQNIFGKLEDKLSLAALQAFTEGQSKKLWEKFKELHK